MNDDNLTNSIVKAIAYTENRGKPNISNPSQGKTGEMKSIFQYTPNTWKANSKEVFGKDDVPLTADNETYVTQQKVKKWVSKGYTARQIASMWNAGPGEPDAYTGKYSDGSPSVGVNKKYGVKFDVPSYANQVLAYSKEFYGQSKSTPSSSNSISSTLSPTIGQSQNNNQGN